MHDETASARNRNIVRFFDEQVRLRPQAEALKIPRGRDANGAIVYKTLDYAALARFVDGCARRLRARGVQKGTRVLLMVRPGLALTGVVYGLFRLGAVPVVIDPGMGVRSFLKCVRRTRPDALVGVPLACALAAVFRKAFATARIRVCAGRSFARKTAAFAGDFPLESAICAPDDTAAILFTSGSTGAPKGVRYTHAIFEAQVGHLRETFGFGAGQVDFPMLPVFSLFNPSLGSTTVVPEIDPSHPARADAAKLVQALLQTRATMSFGSPVLWTKVCDECERRHIVLESLERILSAGAPVPPRLVERLGRVAPAACVQTPYGATEALPVALIDGGGILAQAARNASLDMGTCVGHPVAGVRAGIIPISDAPIAALEDTRFLPAGSRGEIVVSGSVVTAEYDGLPEACARAKIRGAGGAVWHRMGDVGMLAEDGALWFCGRVAERVQTARGVLFTDPCEAVFNAVEGVGRCALVGQGEAGEKTPAIVVEPQEGRFPKSAAERRAFAERLRDAAKAHAHTSDIRRFFFAKRFPVDVRHNAKIHRLHLARDCARGRLRGVEVA